MDGSPVDVYDYLPQYRTISSKLRKRFLRQPNVARASEEFGSLAKSLVEGEAWAQSGVCCLAVARCEQTLSNPMTEIAAVTQAARYFLKAESSCQSLGCPSFNEHLITAISCYQHAIKLHQEQNKPSLASSLTLELGNALQLLGHYSEALEYFQAAADLQASSSPEHLMCLGLVATCCIKLGNLDGALSVFTEMTDVIELYGGQPLSAAFSSILARCEVSSLLILLALQPLPQHRRAQHSKLLEKYSNSSPELLMCTVPYEDRELSLLLQSLVFACQTGKKQYFEELGNGLTPLLSQEQLDLLQILFTEIGYSGH